jgi:hypothetical protein
MPIARPPVSSVNIDATRIYFPHVTATEHLDAGSAVAILPESTIGAGLHYALCGAQDYTNLFVGFLAGDVEDGGTAIVIVGRGSKVTPLVENGVPLIPNEDVFLAMTAGRVTQEEIPIETHTISFRVGSAISDSEVIMSTEFPIVAG